MQYVWEGLEIRCSIQLSYRGNCLYGNLLRAGAKASCAKLPPVQEGKMAQTMTTSSGRRIRQQTSTVKGHKYPRCLVISKTTSELCLLYTVVTPC